MANYNYPDLAAIRADPAHGLPCTRPRAAMCLGGSSEVWQDVLALERLYGRQWDGLVIAANDVGSHWPRVLHHWVSLHPAKFSAWEPLRQQYGFDGGYLKWGRVPQTIVDLSVQPWGGGSSGMLALQVALELGCTRVVLCGIPMTKTPHFAETTERVSTVWGAVEGHWGAWHKCRDRFGDHARSMSGRTLELLGGLPTREWLEGVDGDT